jgi:hypothetical protein
MYITESLFFAVKTCVRVSLEKDKNRSSELFCLSLVIGRSSCRILIS